MIIKLDEEDVDNLQAILAWAFLMSSPLNAPKLVTGHVPDANGVCTSKCKRQCYSMLAQAINKNIEEQRKSPLEGTGYNIKCAGCGNILTEPGGFFYGPHSTAKTPIKLVKQIPFCAECCHAYLPVMFP
jgi:hypothetical protein